MNTRTTFRHFMLCFLMLFTASVLYIGSTTAQAWWKSDKCTLQSITVKSLGKEYTIDGSLKPIEISSDTNWADFISNLEVTSYTVVENEDCTDCYNNHLEGQFVNADNTTTQFIYAAGGDNHSITQSFNDGIDPEYIHNEYNDFVFKVKYNRDPSTGLHVRFIKSYTITYNLDGGNVSSELKTSYTAMDTITLPTPTKEGYTFTGWASDDLTATTMNVVIPEGSYGNRTYTATYKKNETTSDNNAASESTQIGVGDIQKIGRASYTITSIHGPIEVAYKAPSNKKAKMVTIPNTITLKDGGTAKVTSIAANAFKKCTKLKKVTIPTNVTKIGKNAFKGCKNLKNIVVKTKKLTKKSVGKDAFKGIHKKAIIKVPKKKLKAYKSLLKVKGIGKKVKIKK